MEIYEFQGPLYEDLYKKTQKGDVQTLKWKKQEVGEIFGGF